MPAGNARVALRQLSPKPYAIERVETLPALERFLKAPATAEIVWLSDGIDTGRGPEFVDGFAGHRRSHPDHLSRAARASHALAAAENAAAQMTVKVLRADRRRHTGRVRALDQKGAPIGETQYRVRASGSRNRSRVRSAGGVAQRHRPA